MGDGEKASLRLQFNPKVRLAFHGATITTDAGLLAFREFDDALGLTEIAEDYLQESRTGGNILHHLVPLLRQSIYSRLAGYDDTNDAVRLSQDPAMRVIVGWQGSERKGASTSEMGRFETEFLTQEDNRQALARMNTRWVEWAMAHTLHQRVILDMDSSESPVHGQQEGAAYNGHFECVCYHPLFLFNRVLAAIPFKGQAFNLTSAWWFEQTRHIVPNQVLSIPDPNVTIAKKCTAFPIEFVVRAYITGSTNTSLWMVYQSGQRDYSGNDLPDGLMKNQKLPTNILTPTTKEEDHDRPISPDEIVSENWMTADDWEQCSRIAQELFAFGQAKAAERGLILVDTKYEMGRDETGEILLIDEIHTSDSSRYWIADSYQQRMLEGQEPDNVDREFLRLWFRENCNPYEDEVLPPAPDDLVIELSRRHIYLYEKITGRSFEFPEADQPIETRLESNLEGIVID